MRFYSKGKKEKRNRTILSTYRVGVVYTTAGNAAATVMVVGVCVCVWRCCDACAELASKD